jgi:hypothetical protein
MSFFRSLTASRSQSSSPGRESSIDGDNSVLPASSHDGNDDTGLAAPSASGIALFPSTDPSDANGGSDSNADPSSLLSPASGHRGTGVDPSEDPVRVELENEVQIRDARITTLEKARYEKQMEIQQLEEELNREKLHQMKEALLAKIDNERVKRQTAHVEERLQALEADMQDKAAIHEYANLIKGVAPKSVGDDSNSTTAYVTKLQSQLQKAIAKMEATTEQMKLLESQSAEVVDGVSKEITVLVEERSRAEIELRQQMMVLEEQKKDMCVSYEERIRENLKILQILRTKAVQRSTIEELEEELEETENRLEELNRVQETQEKTIAQLTKSLEQEAAI